MGVEARSSDLPTRAVSCPTWNELTSYADRLLQEGSPERALAERHFSRCPSCVQRAFLLDPSWAVSRTSRSELSEPASFGSREIEVLKRSVLETGRIRAVEGSVRERRIGMRVAIAAAVLSVLVGGTAWLRPIGPETKTEGIKPAAEVEFFVISGSAVGLSLPTVAALTPAAARVYDFGQEDFALVMVVHETLDL